MALNYGFASANSRSESLIERVRAAPRQTFWRRLLAWGAFVVLASVPLTLIIPNDGVAPSQRLIAVFGILSGVTALGGTVFCFARFIVFRTTGWLLTSAAFSALFGGLCAQMAADLRAPVPAPYGWLASSGWLIASALFLGGGYAGGVWRRVCATRAVMQFVLSGAVVCVLPAAGMIYALDARATSAFADPFGFALGVRLAESLARVAAPVLLVVALVGYSRLFQRDDDRISALLSYFYITSLVGLISNVLSVVRFDTWWMVGQVQIAASWMVLVVGVGIENAFAHKDVLDRFTELEAAREVSWGLVGAGSAKELIGLLARVLRDKIGAKIAAVYLADETASALELAALCGPEDHWAPVGTTHPINSTDRRPGFHTGHTAKAFTSGEVQIAYDAFVDVAFVPWRMIAVDDGCAVSLPLGDGQETIGVLNVYFADRKQLTRERLLFLATIAASAAPAIQNARRREGFLDRPGEVRSLGLAA